MADGKSWFDVVTTVLIVGADIIAIVGATVLVFHRIRHIVGWGSALVVLWWAVCILGVVSGLTLLFRIGLNEGNSGEDRMMQSLLLLVFGPVCLAATIAAFVKPR